MIPESRLLEIINETFDYFQIDEYINNIEYVKEENDALSFNIYDDESTITISNPHKISSEDEAKAYARYIVLYEDTFECHEDDLFPETNFKGIDKLYSQFNLAFLRLEVADEFFDEHSNEELESILFKETNFKEIYESMTKISEKLSEPKYFQHILLEQIAYSTATNFKPLEIEYAGEIRTISESYVSIANGILDTLKHLYDDDNLNSDEKQIILSDISTNVTNLIDLSKSYRNNEVTFYNDYTHDFLYTCDDMFSIKKIRTFYADLLVENLSYQKNMCRSSILNEIESLINIDIKQN